MIFSNGAAKIEKKKQWKSTLTFKQTGYGQSLNMREKEKERERGQFYTGLMIAVNSIICLLKLYKKKEQNSPTGYLHTQQRKKHQVFIFIFSTL